MIIINLLLIRSVIGFIILLLMTVLFRFGMRRKGAPAKTKPPLPHQIGAYLFCYILVAILAAIGIPALHDFDLNPLINLTPFAEIRTNYIEYMQNILLFIPFGFFLPLLWKRFEKPHRTLIFGALFSLSIEILQLFTYRITDIDDFFMNTLGTMIGYCLFVFARKIIPKLSVFSAGGADFSAGGADLWRREPYFCFALAWITMIFIEPYVFYGLMGPSAFAPGRDMIMLR